MSVAITFGQGSFANESPIVQVEGESITYACMFTGSLAISNPSAIAYRSKSNVSGVVFPAGSITVSGNIVILKPLTGLVGGALYIIAVTATVDGSTVVKKFQIIAHGAGQEQ